MNCFDKVTFNNNKHKTNVKKDDENFLIVVGNGITIGHDVDKTNKAFVKNMNKIREAFNKILQNK